MQFSTALIAAAASAGLAMAAPVLEARYATGQCGIHVTQFQKNENGVGGDYQYTIVIRDAVGAIVGGISKEAIADYQTFSLPSQLPYELLTTSGSIDSDPIVFHYAGFNFESSSGCSVGVYDSGSRQMDCGFPC